MPAPDPPPGPGPALAADPTHAALLRAVCADPRDDTPRLAMADFYEEVGQDSRGALIRCPYLLRHVRVGYGRWEWRYAKLDEGERPYWRCYIPWVYEAEARKVVPLAIRRQMESYTIRRGFVSRVTLPVKPFLAHAEALFQGNPIEEVRLADRQANNYLLPNNTSVYVWDVCEESDITPNSRLPGFIPRVLWESDLISEKEIIDRGRPRAIFVGGSVRRVQTYRRRPRRFPTLELANRALCHACVAHGRALAKLPELTYPADPADPADAPARNTAEEVSR